MIKAITPPIADPMIVPRENLGCGGPDGRGVGTEVLAMTDCLVVWKED